MSESLVLLEEDIRPAVTSKRATGDRGEHLAAEFLEKNGYRIVMANFEAPIGRNSREVQVIGEIDIVALDGETLCFVEVKARRDLEFAGPLTNVDLRKQRTVTRTARAYRRIFRVFEMKHRYDVVTVVGDGHDAQVELHQGFWTESKFRKRKWADDRF
ncbi:MAG: YraN family protein [Pyrinomonadaceae bacterium]